MLLTVLTQCVVKQVFQPFLIHGIGILAGLAVQSGFTGIALANGQFGPLASGSSLPSQAWKNRSALENWVGRNYQVEIDKEFGRSQKDRVLRDLSELKLLPLQAQPGGFFEKIFGGKNSDAVARYFDERVSLLLPPHADIKSRVEATRTVSTIVLARNVGTSFWLESVAAGSKPYVLVRGERQIPIASPRIGVVQLGTGYFAQGAKEGLPTQVRLSTLIHEARHSDCTGGLGSDDVTRMRDKSLSKEDRYPLNRACGHLHSKCLPGHKYAGLMACDSHPWGAYAVEAVYAQELLRSCRNCPEAQRHIAKTIQLEALSRVARSAELMRGSLGDPDMTSADLETK